MAGLSIDREKIAKLVQKKLHSPECGCEGIWLSGWADFGDFWSLQLGVLTCSAYPTVGNTDPPTRFSVH